MVKFTVRQRMYIVKNLLQCKETFYAERGGANRLAMDLGISPQTLSKITHNKYKPSFHMAVKLAGLLDVGIMELCGMRSKLALDPDNAALEISALTIKAIMALRNYPSMNRTISNRLEYLNSILDNNLDQKKNSQSK